VTPLAGLRALGPGEEAPTAAKERVYAALLLGLQASAAAVAGAAVGGLQSQAAGASAGGALERVAKAKLAALGVGVLLLGGVAGAGLYSVLRPPRLKIVYVDRPVPAASTAASVAPPLVVPAPVASSAPAPGSTHAAKLAVAPDTEASELARERALLDIARKSATQGDAAAALETAERHRVQFPSGRLAEEREALAIRALSVLGRTAEARERAQAFRAAYPHSFLAGIVDPAASAP
jgi:hypothetical protein